jgi:putative solute:sodium symporter small subunit
MTHANGDGRAPDESAPPSSTTNDIDEARAAAYWRANMRLMAILLAIWALVSYGFGIWLRKPLDALSIGGAPLGFWFAQQGAIYVFVVLIFVYVVLMKRLDDQYGVDGKDGSDTPRSDASRSGE